ncbi:hypothetical protein K8S19_10330 [bacterium]|nr:hypothetical protein [bacterium]
MKTFMKKLTVFTVALLITASIITPAVYAADVTLDIPVVSQYVWRGILANEEPVLQPSLTVAGSNGLSFNLWGNMDITGFGEEAGYGNRSGEFTEVDLTLDYSYSFGKVGLSAGIISYIFPGLGSTTHELYASVSGDVIASPTLAVYSDVDEVKGSYFMLSLGHSFSLTAGPLTGIDLGLSAGYGSGSYNRGYFGIDEAKPVDLVVSLGLPLSISGISVTPGVVYSYLLDSDISEALDKSSYALFSLTVSLTL